MASQEDDRREFEEVIQKHFDFLSVAGFRARGTRKIGTEGRDSGYVSRFESPDLRIKIGWSSFELSLIVTLKHTMSSLSDDQRYTYFEPLVQFLSEGGESAIVPYVTHRMSARRLLRVMEEREAVFAQGLEPVAQKLAEKLNAHLTEVQSVSADQILRYHDWIGTIR